MRKASDVLELRQLLWGRYGTDFGLSDDALAAAAIDARARVGRKRWSWHEFALEALGAQEHIAS